MEEIWGISDICAYSGIKNHTWCDLDGGNLKQGFDVMFNRTQNMLNQYSDKILADIKSNVYSTSFLNDPEYIEWEFSFLNVVLDIYSKLKEKVFPDLLNEIYRVKSVARSVLITEMAIFCIIV